MSLRQCNFLVLVLVLFTLMHPALTEETLAQAPAPLTLQQCLAIAMQRQSDILQGEHSLDASKARTTEAKSNFLPTLSVQGTSKLAQSGFPTLGERNTLSFSVAHNFYDGGLRNQQLKQATYGVTQTAASLDRTRQTVTFQVTQSYLGLLRSQRQLDVADSQLSYIAGQRDLVKTRIDVGAAAEVDLLPIEAQYANAQVSQLAAQNAVRTASIQLQQDMGVQPQPAFAVQEVAMPATLQVTTLDDYLKTAHASRPEIRETQAAVGAAKAAVSSAKIVLAPYPVVSGQFDQTVTGQSQHTFSLNAGLAYDLFDGGKNRAIYHEQQATLASAEVRAAQLQKDIEADVRNAYLNLTNAQDRMRAGDISVHASQRNMDVQQERYKQGLATTLDLLNAQVDLTTANTNAVQARYDYLTALAQLDFAQGTQGGWYATK